MGVLENMHYRMLKKGNDFFKSRLKLFFFLQMLFSMGASTIGMYLFLTINNTCPDGWTSETQARFQMTAYTSNCYLAKTSTTNQTREQAEAECEKVDSDLASIHSEQENQLAKSLLEKGGWINGLWVVDWIWDDGSPWEFSNVVQEEVEDDEWCLQISASGEWIPFQCNETNSRFLCKKKSLSSLNYDGKEPTVLPWHGAISL